MNQDTAEIPNEKRKPAILLGWLAVILLLLGHGYCCWQLIGGWAGIHGRYPVLNDDHTFNYYAAVSTREYLRQSGSTAGYDPFFMSGYAKSIIWPSSSTLAELVVFLLGQEHPATAYNLYVVGSAILLPVVFLLAVCLWIRDPVARQGAFALYFVYLWTGWAMVYVQFGMVAFLDSSPLALLAIACFWKWICPAEPQGEPRNRYVSVGWWLTAMLLAALLCISHLTAPIVVAPVYIAMIVSYWRHLRLAHWAAIAGFALAVVALNLFWLWPGIKLWATKGDTRVVFINPNVLERLLELFTTSPRIQPTILLLSLIGIVTLIWSRHSVTAAMISGLLWTFFLGFLAGWFRWMDFLQPGRNTLHLFTWCCLIGAIGWSAIVRRLRGCRQAAFVLICIAAVAGSWGPSIYTLGKAILTNPGGGLVTQLPPQFEELIQVLKQHTSPGQRLLFEDRNKGIQLQGQILPDPFGPLRIAPLIPLETGLEVIGGPYLYTHHQTNFTQFGDAQLFGKPIHEQQQFRELASCYQLDWVVYWSPVAESYFRQHRNIVEPVLRVGSAPYQFVLARVRNLNPPRGQADIQAKLGMLIIDNIRPSEGRLDLPYHWVPGLVCDPPTEIEVRHCPGDPVGMVTLVNPPKSVRLWLDPW